MIEQFLLNLLIFGGIFSILGVSLNISMGFTGLFNLGHAAFFGIGAYASALIILGLGMPFFVAFIAAGLITAVFGYLLSLPTRKLRGDYLALATLGFAFIIDAFLRNWTELTRGPLGIPGIPKPEIFGLVFSDLFIFFLLTITLLAAISYITYRLINSPFGKVLKAVREDELAAEHFGKNTFKYKTIALTVSAFFAGLAGSLYAHYITFIDPSSFGVHVLILILSIVIIGGRSIKGSIIAGFLLILIPEPLRFIGLPSSIVGAGRQILYAVILLAILMKRPQGFFDEIEKRLKNDKNQEFEKVFWRNQSS